MKTKICTKCGIEKLIEEFPKAGKNLNNKVYYRSDCKVCNAEESRNYYKQHKKESQIYRHNYYRCNKHQLSIYHKNRYHNNPDIRLRKSLGRMKKETGCSLDELVEFYTTQLDKQQGRCVICDIHISETNTRLHIDHDHSKKGIKSLRALLCSNCNSGIGNLRDSSELCQRAFQYLQSFIAD